MTALPLGTPISTEVQQARRRPRTSEPRTAQKSVRLTPTALAAIRERAAREHLTDSGFIANAALAAALADGPVGRPDTDPRRPLAEALDRLAGELRTLTDTVPDPERGQEALTLLSGLAERTYAALDAVLEAA
ncbi:plasmid mobilization protein [Kitasatospora sp. NPDC003701]|uniref:plasmid mobilization protein n=1 Tax=Kitasatospora sp. NPDC059973 TaxID=3347020 RepID=UPI0036A467BF